MELAKYTDYRGRGHTIVLKGDLVLDRRRGVKTRVVADLRAPASSGRRRMVEQIVNEHTRKARRAAVLLRALQPGELKARERQGQLRLALERDDSNAA
jgi:hypothetical protein